jgi:O-antigen ligase
LIWLPILFIFYLIGMIWTQNKESGFEDLSNKFLLVLLPLLFSSLRFSEKSYRKIYLGLFSGCTVALIVCLIHSFQSYLSGHDYRVFFYTSFSVFLHPTYFTMYLNLLLLMFCRAIFNGNEMIFRNNYLRGIYYFFIITCVILIDARLAMITLFFTLILFSIFESIKLKKLRQMYGIFIGFGIITGILFYFLMNLYNRFDQISDALTRSQSIEIIDTSQNAPHNSATTRIELFKNSIEVFKKNFWFGVGTGDVIDESVKELKSSNSDYVSMHYTGAHNQYLQTAMSLGIFGLITLVLSIFYPFYPYLLKKNYLGLCFVLIVSINALGDTILRASSLYFFSFFGCYLYVFFKKWNFNSGSPDYISS